MKITTVGVDVAKKLFQVHGVDEHRTPVLRKQLKRGCHGEQLCLCPARFTRVWVKQQGRWRLVANHYSSRIPQQ